MKMKRPIFLLFYLIISWVALSTLTLSAQWDNVVLDSVTQDFMLDRVGNKQAIEVDDNGTVHVIWTASIDQGTIIKYNRRSSMGDWGGEIIVNIAGTAHSPVTTLLPGSNRPAVAYVLESGDNRAIMAAYFDGLAWENVAITNTNLAKFSPTIAADQEGNIHLAWIEETQTDIFKIFYGKLTVSTNDVEIEELELSALGGFGSGADPFIAHGTETGVLIGYRGGDFNNYKINLAQKSIGSNDWQYEVINTPNQDDYTSSIVVKGTSIHLLVSGNDGFGIGGAGYYLKKEMGSSWSSPEKVNIGLNGVIGASLHIDDDGNAHCVWEELSGNFLLGNIYYSNNVNGNWGSTPILESGDIHYPNLDFDLDGNGYVFAQQENIVTFDLDHTEAVLITGNGMVNSTSDLGEIGLQVDIFPNPIDFELNFQSPDNQLFNGFFEMYNSSGKLAYRKRIVNESKIFLDRNQLNSGFYFYRIFDKNNRVFSGKVMLK